MKGSKKNLRVRRNLYWANQGLIYAVNALGDLCQESGLPRAQLRQARAMVEEARVLMNGKMAKWTDRGKYRVIGKAKTLPRMNADQS